MHMWDTDTIQRNLQTPEVIITARVPRLRSAISQWRSMSILLVTDNQPARGDNCHLLCNKYCAQEYLYGYIATGTGRPAAPPQSSMYYVPVA